MENKTLDESTVDNSNLNLDKEGQKYLKESRGWAMFLAILGFIGMGFMVIGAIVMFAMGGMLGSQLGFPSGLIGVLYLVIAGIYVIPLIFMFQFAQKAGNACDTNDSNVFREAIKNLRSFFKSTGIMIISFFVIYIIIIIVVISMGITKTF
jgi:hypothetical protein